jgi:hypothetical protein
VGGEVVTEVHGDHRATLERILRHPASGNIEWREVKSLLDAVGATTEEHNGKLKVTLGGETEVLEAPRGKDIDAQMRVVMGAGVDSDLDERPAQPICKHIEKRERRDSNRGLRRGRAPALGSARRGGLLNLPGDRRRIVG